MEPILFSSFFVSLFFVLFLMPHWIKRAKKARLTGKDMNKYEKPGIAEMGGIVVIGGFVLGLLAYVAISTFYFKQTEQLIFILAALSTILLMTLIGILDDLLGWKIGIRQRYKPLLALVAALPLMAVSAGESVLAVPLAGTIDLGVLYFLLVIPLGIVGASNGFNMLAGYNGLEAGMGTIILSFLGYAAWITGNSWVALMAFLMVASLLGFLVYNRHPARVFPGDSLTYSVGALIAVVAILADLEKIAVFLFIPYFFEFILKARGKFRKESYSVPKKDGSIRNRYRKIYGLEHAAIRVLGKIRKDVHEKDVVISLLILELALAALAYRIFL